MCGAGARQTRDDDRGEQLDVVDLGVPRQQVGEQQPVLQPLQQLGVVVDDAGRLHAADLLQRSKIHVETLAVVVGTEVVEAGVGGGLGVQYVGVERALGRHHRHHVADLLRLGAEAGLCEVVEVDDGCLGIGHGDLCYSELRNENRPWSTS